MTFVIRVRVVISGGTLRSTAEGLEVNAADAVTLLLSAATSYHGWDKSPGREGVDADALARSQMRAAASKSFLQLLKSAVIHASQTARCRVRAPQAVRFASRENAIPVREISSGVHGFDAVAGGIYRVSPK